MKGQGKGYKERNSTETAESAASTYTRQTVGSGKHMMGHRTSAVVSAIPKERPNLRAKTRRTTQNTREHCKNLRNRSDRQPGLARGCRCMELETDSTTELDRQRENQERLEADALDPRQLIRTMLVPAGGVLFTTVVVV